MIDPKTDPLDSAYADVHFKDRCCQLITASGARTVCEIGGGRSPLLSLDEVRALKLDYTTVAARDVSNATCLQGSERREGAVGNGGQISLGVPNQHAVTEEPA